MQPHVLGTPICIFTYNCILCCLSHEYAQCIGFNQLFGAYEKIPLTSQCLKTLKSLNDFCLLHEQQFYCLVKIEMLKLCFMHRDCIKKLNQTFYSFPLTDSQVYIVRIMSTIIKCCRSEHIRFILWPSFNWSELTTHFVFVQM